MTISFTTKKVVALAMGLALATSAVFVSSASADTADDLQAQITSLLAMIAGLQAQLGGDTTTPTTGGSCTAAQFTLTHKVGDRGGEVMNIQKFLNASGFTVATAGAGSAGMETSFFGPATKAAAMAFQNAYASEILAPVGLSTGTGYWGSSSRAKANALEMARCAGSSNDDDDDNAPTGDNDLTVSAAAQPGNSLAPSYAQGVAFTNFTITAGDDDVMIDNIIVELTGLASRGAFDTLALLDEDGVIVGDTDSIDSDDQAKIGKNLKVRAGKSETFTVVANMDLTTNYAGEVASLSIVAINTDATVEGSLPITGAQHTINSTLTVGYVEITDAGTARSVDIQDDKVKIAELNIKAHDEDLSIFSVRLHQEGDADLEKDIDDVVAKFDGDTYDVEIDGDYLIVDLDGAKLEKGDNEDLVITATIVGGADDTITFEVEEITDVVAVGDDYGYGARVDDDTTKTDNYTTETLSTITIGKADVTISKTTDVDDEKVAAGSDEAELASFDVEAEGDDVTGDIDMIITLSGGVFPADASDADLDNVAIYNADGDRISDREDFAWTADGSTTVEFKDVVFESDEDALDYTIRGDINTDAVTNAIYTVTSIQYKSIETVDGDDVVTPNPTAVTLGHAQTVEGSAITLSIENADEQEVNADTTEVVLAELKLDANNSGDDVNVSEIKVKFTIADTKEVFVTTFAGNETGNDTTIVFDGTTITLAATDATGTLIATKVAAGTFTNFNVVASTTTVTFTQKVAAELTDVVTSDFVVTANTADATAVTATVASPTTQGSTAVNSDVKSCALYDGTTKVSDKEDSDSTSVAYDVDIDVEKDEEKVLTVMCNLSDDFKNGNTIAITGVSFKAKGTVTGTDLDTTFTSTTTATVTDGTAAFTLVTSHDDNDNKAVMDDADEIILGRYEFKANDAELEIDDVTVTFVTSTGGASTEIDGKVEIWINGVREDSENPTTANIAVVSFTDLLYKVDSDETVVIEFKADADAAGTVEIDTVAMTTKEGVSVTSVTTDGPTVTIAAALPVIVQIDTDTDELNTGLDQAIFGFSVTAEGGDVTIDQVKAALTNSGTVVLNNQEWRVYDTATADFGTDDGEITPVTFNTGALDTITYAISENDTIYVYLVVDVLSVPEGSSLLVVVTDADASLEFTADTDADLLLEGDMKSLLSEN